MPGHAATTRGTKAAQRGKPGTDAAGYVQAGLCLYWGEAGHLVAECLTKNQKNIVTPNTHTSHKQFLVNVLLNVTNLPVLLSILLDSGLAGNFVSTSLVSSLALPVEEIVKQVSVRALDGQLVTKALVTHITCPLSISFLQIPHTLKRSSSMLYCTLDQQWF